VGVDAYVEMALEKIPCKPGEVMVKYIINIFL
jgi:hypothetical protein